MQRLANLMGWLVQSTGPLRIRARDAWLNAIDGTHLQRLLAENVKPLPSYREGAFARRSARIPARRTVGMLFPQHGRLDDRLGSGWSIVALDQSSAFDGAGVPVVHPGGDWLRTHDLAWALLRPDRYVFACGRSGDLGPALEAWRRIAKSSPKTKEHP